MKVTRFDPDLPLILVRGVIEGPLGRAQLRLAVDTGAEQTLIVPGVLDQLGYSAREGEAIMVIRSAIGEEPGYLLRVSKFLCLGHQASDFRVHAHDLPQGTPIDGLLGLSFLRQFNYEVRSAEGRLLVARI